MWEEVSLVKTHFEIWIFHFDFLHGHILFQII